MANFFQGDGKAALTRAIVAFEAATAVELVIAVRPRSDTYPHVAILAGVVMALATTTFLLYGEPEFDLHWFLVAPLVVGLAAGFAASTGGLQWLLTRAATREQGVLRAARATFVEKSMADTRGRTGVLLYVSLAERVAVMIADLGVRQAVPPARWGPGGGGASRPGRPRGRGQRPLTWPDANFLRALPPPWPPPLSARWPWQPCPNR